MTIDRRDLIVGGLCAAALGTAEWLRPRGRLLLLPAGLTLEALIPERFGGWRQSQGEGVVLPPSEGSLADRLYDEQVMRTYAPQGRGPQVMLLATYGRDQSDGLQLHRPESCYPAVGFMVTERRLAMLPLTRGISVPVVHLTARFGARVEDIVYWTRLGDALPQTAGEQRSARLQSAIAGVVGDGVLIRASAVRGADGAATFTNVEQFLRELLLNVPPARRAAFVGSALAARLTGQ